MDYGLYRSFQSRNRPVKHRHQYVRRVAKLRENSEKSNLLVTTMVPYETSSLFLFDLLLFCVEFV